MSAQPKPLQSNPSRESADITPNLSHTRDSHILVRERRFPSSQDIAALMRFLHNNHSTGLLMINISQGSVSVVRYREEINVTEP